MSTSNKQNWLRLDALLSRSCQVLRKVFKQRWFNCMGSIWEDTPQCGDAFLHSPFGMIYQIKNEIEKQHINDGNTNEWHLTMLAAVLIGWTVPISSSFYQTIKNEKKYIQNLKEVSNFCSHQATKQLDEVTFKNKWSILIRSLTGLGEDPTELEQLKSTSTTSETKQSNNGSTSR